MTKADIAWIALPNLKKVCNLLFKKFKDEIISNTLLGLQKKSSSKSSSKGIDIGQNGEDFEDSESIDSSLDLIEDEEEQNKENSKKSIFLIF